MGGRDRWDDPDYLHPLLREPLAQTYGVVVFHEQVLHIVAATAGVSLAEADEVRRAMGSPAGQVEVETWWRPLAAGRGIAPVDVDRIWEVLKAFASFGFCKAHAAAFALPTYQSAWLKTHHPAAFLAGVLTHDPGMYPKRLILDDARNLGIAVLGLDVNRSDETYRVEKVEGIEVLDHAEEPCRDQAPRSPGYRTDAAVPDGSAYGIRLSLADVKGISEAEVARVVAGQPYHSLADFAHRARVTRPVAERLVVAGAFDSLYGLSSTLVVRRRGHLTRRDLLLQLAELERWTRGTERAARAAAPRSRRAAPVPNGVTDVRTAAARQSRAARPVGCAAEQSVQLALDLGDAPEETVVSGLPEMTGAERVRAELEVLGLDVSRHVVDFYTPLLRALGTTRSPDLVHQRSRRELLVAGVKVATQTPPIRSGRRVVFLTLDDSSGPLDATFFEDVQGPYAATVFGSWLLVVRGELRRTGPRGVSLRATGAWDLTALWDAWTAGGLAAVHAEMAWADGFDERAVAGAAASRSTRPVMVPPPQNRTLGTSRDEGAVPWHEQERRREAARYAAAAHRTGAAAAAGDAAGDAAAAAARVEQDDDARAGGMGGGARHRRVLVHASGFRQSPYADVKPPGDDVRDTRGAAAREAPRKLWHSSPGSSGR